MTGEFNPTTRDELVAGDKAAADFVDGAINGITEHYNDIKAAIVKYARGYDYDRIYKTDLAALLLACYEIMYTDTPKAVVANEAVEIVKAYSDAQSYSFVNGILASVIKGE